MNILITSVGTATSINLIKSLQQLNHNIIGVDINKYGFTAGSMMVNRYYQVPYAADKNFLNEIKNIIANEKIDLLIPINDSEVETLAAKRDYFKHLVLIPDINTLALVRNKYECTKKIRSIDVPIPEMIITTSANCKCILRDNISVGSKGIQIFESIPKNWNKETSFVQKFIEGEEYTVDILCDSSSNPKYIIPRKRIEVKSGVVTKTETINDKKLIEYCKTILSEVKLPGFSNIQFIKDKKGDYYFIEINPRFSGGGSAAILSTDDYVDSFIEFAKFGKLSNTLNKNVKWNQVITRYYEEKIYDNSNSRPGRDINK